MDPIFATTLKLHRKKSISWNKKTQLSSWNWKIRSKIFKKIAKELAHWKINYLSWKNKQNMREKIVKNSRKSWGIWRNLKLSKHIQLHLIMFHLILLHFILQVMEETLKVSHTAAGLHHRLQQVLLQFLIHQASAVVLNLQPST
jgi:hypothetical protein